MNDIEIEIKSLPLNTLSTLSGLEDPEELLRLKKAWIDHAVNSGVLFKGWIDAWEFFVSEFNLNVERDALKLKTTPDEIRKKIFI